MNPTNSPSTVPNNKANTPFTKMPSATPYQLLASQFAGEVRTELSQVQGEIADRNNTIAENDEFIYGRRLEQALDIPIGHDFTKMNWLRRSVEIHRTQFMGRGFTMSSTYDAVDVSNAQDDQDKQRLDLENKKRKDDAERRRTIIDGIVRDNGGNALWANAAENASAVGTTVVKAWYDEDQAKYVIQNVEAIENCYAVWNRDDYRTYDMFAYVYQISKEQAARLYDIPPTTPTSPLGLPLTILGAGNYFQYVNTEEMITVMEITGTVAGWRSHNGILERCNIGKETKMNALIVGNQVNQVIDDEKKLPHYYILPNKLQRRRPWGVPDISRGAIDINLTFIETWSDWRTLSSRVNFPKWKAFGFATGTQLPKPTPRRIEALPLTEGQDLQPLSYGNAVLGQEDFQKQIAELKEDYVREVGISRQLFDMPDGPSDSGQAMLIAMRSVSDLTEAKKQLWTPVITKMFEDALEVLGQYDDNIKDLLDPSENWYLRVIWPSQMSKEDPTYQTMLLNRFNAGTMSIGSYLEAQGDSREEIDRIRDEMDDPLTAAIHGRMLGVVAEQLLTPPPDPNAQPEIKQSISWKGDLTPQQAGNLADENGWQAGPFGASIGPQGNAGQAANDNEINQGFLNGNPYSGGTPNNVDAQGNPVDTIPGNDQQQGQPQPGAGQGQPEQIAAGGVPGAQPMSQPGSGAPPTTPQGKVNQQQQRQGK